MHIIALDEIEHEHGPFGAPAFETLEQLDKMIGEMVDAALATDPRDGRRGRVGSRVHRDAYRGESANAVSLRPA